MYEFGGRVRTIERSAITGRHMISILVIPGVTRYPVVLIPAHAGLFDWIPTCAAMAAGRAG